MRTFDIVIKCPSRTAPTALDQPVIGAFIIASSDEFAFPEAGANTAAIESEIAKAKNLVTKQPKETRRLTRLARLFPEHAPAIVDWLVVNGKTSIAAKIECPPFLVSCAEAEAAKNVPRKRAGRPLDDELPYQLARFESAMKDGKHKSRREAALALGEGGAPSLQNKLSIFRRAFALSRKPRIVRGPNHLKETTMSRDPNDDRSDSMNPNNDAYWDSLDNHADQLNPNNAEYRGPDEDDAAV